MALTKATITNVSRDGSPKIDVLFNPTELSVDSGSHYASMPMPGLSMPILQYIRGESEVLHLDLFLDRTDEGRNVEGDLRLLKSFIQIDSSLHAPPVIEFAWGGFVLPTTVGCCAPASRCR